MSKDEIVVNKGNVAINHKGLCTGNKNNNVLIKEIIAGLIQPEWVQQRRQWVPSGTPGCSFLARPCALQHAPTRGNTE